MSDFIRGDYLRNPDSHTMFSCPQCHLTHTVYGVGGRGRYVRCVCGAPLHLTVQQMPVTCCTIVSIEDEKEQFTEERAREQFAREYPGADPDGWDVDNKRWAWEQFK